MKPDAFWRDQCVLITGASSGIGAATAQHLAACGARVGLIARRTELLDSLTSVIRARGQPAAFAPADVTDFDALTAAARSLQKELGPCGVLVANAGIYRMSRVTDFDPVKAHAVVAANLQGVINAVAAVLPGMIERRRGHLAAVSSIAGLVALPSMGVYRASKAGVIALMDSLRVDLHPLGVKVTLIGPGFVDTPMITDRERATVKNLVRADDAARRIARAIARGRRECWFPWSTWALARAAHWLPWGVYRRILASYPELEGT
jgi:NADP-dependent 3-hydroxy acid dehydrogenase YdfG